MEVPDELMARHVIAQAREYGEYGEVHDRVSEGPYGAAEYETEWSIADLDPQECDVDMRDDTVSVKGIVMGEYAVQVASATYNPPAAAHPAEYETRERELFVEIEMELGTLPFPVVNVEIA